ncbi:MAG: D-(-)-3-hydroxybutyrate oligomer hydrolase [Haliangiales bacterium]
MSTPSKVFTAAALAAALALAPGCGDDDSPGSAPDAGGGGGGGGADAARPDAGPDETPNYNNPPTFLLGELLTTRYADGDDLLTAGLGVEGLRRGMPAPRFANPVKPTVSEIRRLAYFRNVQALVDTSDAGGYGRLYGPGVGGADTVEGREYLVIDDDAGGRRRTGMLVQIPDSFDPDQACIVAAPSSAARTVYGAVGTTGEWALQKGCAVAYTDKGMGTGLHDLENDTVTLVTGEQVSRNSDEGANASFIAIDDVNEQQAFLDQYPHRLALKTLHSQRNPEQLWDTEVLQSIELGFYVLNLEENYGEPSAGGTLVTLTPENTLVIAASISNGGGSVLRAAELEVAIGRSPSERLIDAVVASEPQVYVDIDSALAIAQGSQSWANEDIGRSLADYWTFLNVYLPCALLAPEVRDVPLNFPEFEAAIGGQALSESRCAGLADAGLLEATEVEAQAIEALQLINDYGILREANPFLPVLHSLDQAEGIAVTYLFAYGGFDVTENVCGFSVAAVDSEGAPATLSPETAAALFSSSNGTVPAAGLELINDDSEGGAKATRVSVSAGGVQDQNLPGALCLRRLLTGVDHLGEELSGVEKDLHLRLTAGLEAARATANLGSTPTIIVNGRSDSILAPNHTSRAYFGQNQLAYGDGGLVRYYEVTNGQHLDVLNELGYQTMAIPLHYYFAQSLDLMYEHLMSGAALPPSQLVRTTTRGLDADDAPEPLELAHMPAIAAEPAAADAIAMDGDTLTLPDQPITTGRAVKASARSRQPALTAADRERLRTVSGP